MAGLGPWLAEAGAGVSAPKAQWVEIAGPEVGRAGGAYSRPLASASKNRKFKIGEQRTSHSSPESRRGRDQERQAEYLALSPVTPRVGALG